MRKHLILLLGMFLGSYLPTAAQAPPLLIVPAQDRLAPITALVQTVPAPLLAGSLLLPENLEKSAAHLSYAFAEAYERDRGMEGLESLSPMREVKTLFRTQSSLPLVYLWGGRLRFDGFTSTLHMQNLLLGPSAAGGLQDFRPSRQNYPGELHSVDVYGLSLSFHFGRDAQRGRPMQIWRCLARIVGAAR
jgi:hypothetical protein